MFTCLEKTFPPHILCTTSLQPPLPSLCYHHKLHSEAKGSTGGVAVRVDIYVCCSFLLPHPLLQPVYSTDCKPFWGVPAPSWVHPWFQSLWESTGSDMGLHGPQSLQGWRVHALPQSTSSSNLCDLSVVFHSVYPHLLSVHHSQPSLPLAALKVLLSWLQGPAMPCGGAVGAGWGLHGAASRPLPLPGHPHPIQW